MAQGPSPLSNFNKACGHWLVIMCPNQLFRAANVVFKFNTVYVNGCHFKRKNSQVIKMAIPTTTSPKCKCALVLSNFQIKSTTFLRRVPFSPCTSTVRIYPYAAVSSGRALLQRMSWHPAVYLRVCLYDIVTTIVSPAKTGELIEMTFCGADSRRSRNHVWECTLAPPGEYDRSICAAGCYYCSNYCILCVIFRLIVAVIHAKTAIL